MALAASPISERKRVKLYELQESDWFDRGTGLCTVESISQDGRIFVESEESPNSHLLDIKIKKDDNFQKQQDTLIVWTDPNGIDMALSFQEPDGCSSVWDTLREARERLGGFQPTLLELPRPTLGELEKIEDLLKNVNGSQQAKQTLINSLVAENYVAKLAPLVEQAEDFESLEDLHRLYNIMKQLILFNDQAIIEQAVEEDVFDHAIGALEYDPEFPHHKANHRQFFREHAKFKEIVEISDPVIRRKIHYTYRLHYLKDVALARILDDPSFSIFNSIIYFHHMDIVNFVSTSPSFLQSLFGIINSKDRSLQDRKDAMAFVQQSCQIAKSIAANHRNGFYQNLLNSGLFQAINFALQNKDSAIRIAGTDVLLAIIDHDMMMMRNTVHRATNENMTPITDTLIDLFLIETDFGVKAQVADAIKILLDCSPNPGPTDPTMGSENSLAAKFRNGAMHQTNRIFLEKHLQRSMKKLFQPLMDLDKRTSCKHTVELLSTQADSFLVSDFSIDEASLFTHLTDILSFFVKQPIPQPKTFILSEQLIPRTARLMSCADKHLKLAVIKFCKSCACAIDPGDFYLRSLIKYEIFTQLLDFIAKPKDNLLNSAVLDLFEQIRTGFTRDPNFRQSRFRGLIEHLAETYKERFEKITYTTIFADILRQDERIKDPNIPSQNRTEGDMDSSFMTSDAGSPSSQQMINGGSSRWGAALREDANEEAYFSTQDGDDDQDELSRDHDKLPNGVHASPVKPLVDYGDDEDDELAANDEAIAETPPKSSTRFRSLMDEDTSSSPTPAHNNSSPNDREMVSSDTTAPTSTPPPPPVSITEKRRREEDDDDELGKLMDHGPKRRNSAGANSISGNSDSSWSQIDAEDANSPSASGKQSPEAETETPKINLLRRRPRQSFGNGAAGPPKISFKLGAATTAADKGKR